MRRIICSVALLAFVGCQSPEAREFARGVGKPAGDFELEDLDGKTVKLSDFRGKPVVLSFFGHG